MNTKKKTKLIEDDSLEILNYREGQDTYQFRLIRVRESVLSDKAAPSNYSIPYESVVLDVERHPIKVRYVPTEKSIIASKQEDFIRRSENQKRPIRMKKPRFTNGLLSVDIRKGEKALLHYLLAHEKYGIDFELIDNVSKRQEQMEMDEKISKEVAHVYSLTDEEVNKYARFLGYQVKGVESTDIRYRVVQFVRENLEDFISLKNEPNLNIVDVIARAFDADKIAFNPTNGEISWAGGQQFFTIAKGRDPVQELATWVNNEFAGKQVYNTLRKWVDEPDEVGGEDVSDEVRDMSHEDFIEALKEKEVIKWNTPYFYFKGSKAVLGNGKTVNSKVLLSDFVKENKSDLASELTKVM